MNSVTKYKNKRLRAKPIRGRKALSKFRKSYQGTRRWDWSCRNHGSCGYCADNRAFKAKRRAPIPEWELVGHEEDVIHGWETYGNPWDWGTVEEMQWDRHCELSHNERELYQLDRIMEIINNRFDTSEVIPCHTLVS